eukprot:snap_masked-scaffold_60-processed-gene-0.4-mRNA-1 protein AED:0.77 eAED:1.00 QI:0/-1/0/1/-1/1/1/0/63
MKNSANQMLQQKSTDKTNDEFMGINAFIGQGGIIQLSYSLDIELKPGTLPIFQLNTTNLTIFQ